MRATFRLALGAALAVGGVVASLTAQAQPARFDPRRYRDFAGPASQVLVLGTPHLSGMPDTFRPEQLAPLLDRLAAWKPQLVTIEALSGPQCEYLRRYAALHDDPAKDYCPDPSAAQRALGLDMAGATLAAEAMLRAWPAAPSAGQRRRLAALFLAGGDPTSAVVQWLRLPANERRAGDGLDDALVAIVTKAQARRNENVQIAAVLAARLGLERVYPTDDHTADDEVSADPGYGKAIGAVWDNPYIKQRLAKDAALNAAIAQPGGMLSLYRAYNDPAEAETVYRSDYGAALNEASPQRYGRRYAGWWETRNLRMVANIRAVLAKQPGARLLTIVGASHKQYFDAYLDMMHDVAVVDAQTVLR
ncbi:hypothetical protein F1C10_07020 [Sphingomonas sp. NBWT7]|uniref:DUF5694 domain-containing protein n=1 Tax=Sphingomonas sp. NBWT7 TaxID=2596913 RepID=UPI001629D5F1|nr:DUF5694 domain-containing protein [Sphingomonas sp. NBWT7]QNE31708.1 hypothetical protein F1C10_07020 [Sphingomonas sp. NBWT7]